ncbi:NADAR family protein [Bacillus sp. FJAT-28004]|uniref:NADAR family protein n=1 Tax=Bacillus sp. FJAT-28004 TaxID=1679165 RepID=UPI0007C7CF14|nr:NADAR family protein [Bacillus sp. FJAT-28004]
MDEIAKIAKELLKNIEENKRNLLSTNAEKKIINFYEINKPYGCFSNFSKHSITLQNKEWPTTEHYFQAQKFVGTVHEDEIRFASTPMDAARLGRDKNKPLRKDWEECKVNIMREAIVAKIEQHPNVKSVLLSTGDCAIVEHTTNDSYWGDGGDGQGKNMLGNLLMNIRNNMENYEPEFFLPQWIAFPDIHPFSIRWRMGNGETYLTYLWEWRRKQSPEALKEYDDYFTPPEIWAESKKMQEAMRNKSNEE